jgi:hypothetical protein
VADANLAGAPAVAQNIQLGGLSGLVALDAFGTEFVAVTDSGPTADLRTADGSLMVMPLPAFTPSIVKLRLEGNQLKVSERISLRLQEGYTNPRTGNGFVTGLPSSPSEPAAFDPTGRNSWGTDPNGVDPEGIAIDPRDGSYWIADENGPSILHVAADGTIVQRLIPAGRWLDAPGQGVAAILPGELARNKALRGFEGIAVSPDGSRLFAIMQSPLSLPSEEAGEGSRNVRLLTLDLTGPEPTVDGMFVYQTQPYDTAIALSQDHVQVSDLTAVSADRLVVVEHDNLEGGHYKMAYLVELAPASNILGWEGSSNGFVETGDIGSVGVVPVEKTPLANLGQLGWQRDAVEGITMVDDSTLAVISDNNFGFGGFDRAGRLLTNAHATRLSIVHLPGPVR